ncbi:MAG: TonB family protein [bacterium]|nr:TonB family protein [bacterium]
MDTQRWRRAREIYTAALERPTGERAVFLDECCSSDQELRHEVERLLDSGTPSGTYVERAVRDRRQLPEGFAEVPAGRTLGKYEILEQIGQGGFGVVFKGHDPILQRDVAIKTCTNEDSELRRRFFREGRIAAGLQHANVTTIHELGIESEMPYLVQEFLSGRDLTELMAGTPIEPATKLEYLIQIARGLEYAHAQGVLHRDIKPANIRVLPSGVVKIMDFGIARLLSQDSRLTATGAAVGTAGYLAPEQLQADEVDTRADIFSFGALAYELLSGQRPFEADSFARACYRLLQEDPAPLDTVWAECPDARLSGIVARCLEKKPSRRYASMTEVLAQLEAVLAALRSGESVVRPAVEANRDWPSAGETAATRVRVPAAQRPLPADLEEKATDRLETPAAATPAARRWPQAVRLAAAAAVLVAVGVSAWWWGASRGGRVQPAAGEVEIAQETPAEQAPPSAETGDPPPDPGPDLAAESSPSTPEPSPTPQRVTPPPPAEPSSSIVASEPASPETEAQPLPTQVPETESAAVEPTPPKTTAPATDTADAAEPVTEEPDAEGDRAAGEPMWLGTLISELGPGVVEPRIIDQVQPEYPRSARRRRREAQVLVLVLVDENGHVINAILKKRDDSGLGFNEAALEAARQAKFHPATRDGIRGKMWTELPFDFRLDR